MLTRAAFGFLGFLRQAKRYATLYSHPATDSRFAIAQALRARARNRPAAPENASAQLELTKSLLKKGATTPDIYGIDVIWPGMLSDYLVDLKPYFAAESRATDPELTANYTVKGRLVAMPYHSNTGVLFLSNRLAPEVWLSGATANVG